MGPAVSYAAAVLTATGRRLRLTGLLVVAALLLLGSLRGTDDDFPFGPFRMYATADSPDGTVLSTTLEAVTADGRRVGVDERDIGLRRAEYEGQLARVTPGVLRELVGVHARRRPGGPAWVGLRVVQTTYPLHHGIAGPATRSVLVTWQR